MTYETQFLLALTTTLLIEIPVAIILVKYIFKEKIPFSRIIGIGILATALTIPYLRFIFAAYLDYRTMAIVGEIFVFFMEAIIYRKLLPIKFKKAVLISFLANITSILV